MGEALKAPPNGNKRFGEMTLEELRGERQYWDDAITKATGWGAAIKAADEFRRQCDWWIEVREREPQA